MTFFDRLAERIDAVDSVVSVGLDPDPDRLPAHVADATLSVEPTTEMTDLRMLVDALTDQG
jgi:hypothetical protein